MFKTKAYKSMLGNSVRADHRRHGTGRYLLLRYKAGYNSGTLNSNNDRLMLLQQMMQLLQ